MAEWHFTTGFKWEREVVQWQFIVDSVLTFKVHSLLKMDSLSCGVERGGGLGSRPKNMYGERLGDGVEYHLMKPTPRR